MISPASECALLQLGDLAPPPLVMHTAIWRVVVLCASVGLGARADGKSALLTHGDALKALKEKKLKEGLHPHHSTGAHAQDARRFRHRFQMHDFETDELTYLEYEARHHEDVVTLDKLGVQSCIVRPMAENRTAVQLVIAASAKRESVLLTAGSILLGKVVCTAMVGEAEKLWAANFQERIVQKPVVSDANEKQTITLSLVTTSASVHECFESSQIEFFRGKTTNFQAARDRRRHSFAANGESVPKDNFTDAIKVIAEAKAAERELNKALARPASNATSAYRNASRQLSHYWQFCPKGLNSNNDLNLELRGRDCGDSATGDNCYWRRGSEYLLRPGGSYSLRWSGNSGASQVKIGLYERDSATWNPLTWLDGDDECLTIRGGWITNRQGQTNEISFTMPDWGALSRCAGRDGLFGTGGL